jgi:pimeloyl-ACP methyl ester carboxylesterase
MPMTKENLIKLYQNSYSDTETFKLHTIDDSYHFIMWDQPQEFYKQFNLALED